MHPAVEKELAAIEADKEDGAAQLAARGLDLLAEAAGLGEELPAEKYLEGMALSSGGWGPSGLPWPRWETGR